MTVVDVEAWLQTDAVSANAEEGSRSYFQEVLRDQDKVLSMLEIPLLASATLSQLLTSAEKAEGQRLIAALFFQVCAVLES